MCRKASVPHVRGNLQFSLDPDCRNPQHPPAPKKDETKTARFVTCAVELHEQVPEGGPPDNDDGPSHMIAHANNTCQSVQ